MTNKYNDGLDNETVRQIITTYRRPTQNIITDLGTVPASLQKQNTTVTNAVMFSNSISNCELNLKEKEKTLQQADNVAGEARVVPGKASGLGLAEKKEDHGVLRGNTEIRDLGNDQHIVQVEIQVANMRDGRYNRADVYLNLMTENDNKYTIKLVSNVTNAFSEVVRSCKGKEHFLTWVNTLIDSELPNLMIGRARYKVTKGRALWQTKRNLGNVLVAYFVTDNVPNIMLFLFDEEPIIIPLDKELSQKQKQYYTYSGLWRKELPDL
jgi:hypothetical protein